MGEPGEVFAGPARRVERLLSGEGEPAADGGGPFALYHGLYWLTVNLSAAGSLALLVDDLHWCDPPSVAAVEYLGRAPGGPAGAAGHCLARARAGVRALRA